ncbi:MAG TPA: ABC transporter ATP-binding protein [Actinomycetota bacterium]|nr:ABC transporter ATP-binding protein [Actinomycetota bacterium]
MGGESIVAVEHLTKVYRSRRRSEVRAVDDVSFDVAPGEIVGLLGPNGAGKTTTIKCLCTLVSPTSGRIVVDGVDAAKESRAATAKLAAVLEGNRNIYWRLTALENLEYFAALHGVPRRSIAALSDELIDRFGLAEARNADARTLSRGMQQKLAVACAFVKQTPILLLDEPTLGLDVETSLELRGMLRSLAADAGRTILLSSHDMDVVQDVCERVVIINNGRIVTADRIDNLLDLFRVRAYRFTVQGRVDETALHQRFNGIGITTEGNTTLIEVEIVDGGVFYELVDTLRGSDAVIESIDRKDPDLEEVFLRIVRGEVYK